ncbi:hypothetical protein MKW92_050438 [Papaver armeniacum]|nr:hypothetical protein MKW92_050438 [Papaver armeniacum]
MLSEMGMRQGGDDLGILLREQRRQQESNDRERELNIFRSGSAPPTVEGSLSAVGGLFGGGGGGGGDISMSEEELRSDPAYHSYYYSNVNLNPRLPPPLLSKEDWRYAQRLQGGTGGGGGGSIGDRRKVNRTTEDQSRVTSSLFSAQPGFNSDVAVEEKDNIESRKQQEWGGDGLIGLSGFGLGNRQRSYAEIFQDDMSRASPVSAHPSRPASRNAFNDTGDPLGSSEAHLAHLNQELDSLRSNASAQGLSGVQSVTPTSHTYSSALGASLSRSSTPDPQLARAPSPLLQPVGGGRVVTSDKRSFNSPNSFHGVSSGMNDPSDLVSALSGMSLSASGARDEESHLRMIQQENEDHQNFFNLQGGAKHMNQHSYPKKSDLRHVGSNEQSELHRSAVSSPNSYLRGPSTPTRNNAGGSPSRYQNADSMNPALPNYNLGNFSLNPAMPSMMANQLGSGNLPSLFDNVAAASAMAAAGIDSRTLGGPNLVGAAEFQNLNRMGNQAAGSGLQMPGVDPLYVQYLRAAEYAATLNDPSMDRNYVGNSYVDLLGLQKAYLGALLSPQKSQFALPFLGKSASLNHGYYGNPAYGLGVSYPGSPLASPVLPNSPGGPGSPMRHNDRSMRFPSGIRNLAGGMMGSWHSEAGGNADESFASTLLEEFKSNKTRSFELSEIAGHVVEFSADQYGSRFIQQKLETATMEEKDMVFDEILPQAFSLMTDVFGNYVIQKFFEHGSPSQRRELANQLTGHVLTLSLQMYGCRVIQKAIEVVDLDQQTQMVGELDGHVMRCVRDQNGNHVIQKCIECIPQDAIHFIVSTFYDQVVTLSTHPYGCRVIQRVLEHCDDATTQRIMMDEIMKSICMLAQDQYGNYVVQHVLEHGKPHERSSIITKLAGQIVQMSQQKFASNVVEKCLAFGGPVERQILVNEMLGTTDENEPLQAMMKDQFANYVVQKVLETVDDHQRELILGRIKVHLNALKKYTYGKHIVARVEKLVAAGERRIGLQSAYASSMA